MKNCMIIATIETFPCEDLLMIDQLWVKYSNGRFGFSVQKRIYQSLGGSSEFDKEVLTRIKASERDHEVWKRFGDTVGWRKNRDWVEGWGDLNFSTLAPEGHLPWLFSTLRFSFNLVEWVCRDSLLSSGDL